MSTGQQLVLVGLMAIALLPMAGAVFVSKQIAKEQLSYPQIFGESRSAIILDRADRWFRVSFVDTGIVASTMKSTEPKMAGKPAPVPVKKSRTKVTGGVKVESKGPEAKPMPGVGDTPAAARLGKHWLGGAWSIVYMGLIRISALFSVLPFLIPIFVAVIVDGEARRKLKWHSFGGADPKRFVMGARMATWCMALSFASLFCPGALPALAPAVLLVMAAVGFALWTANQQKPV